MTLETVADLATIIACIIASGAILKWAKETSIKSKPITCRFATYTQLESSSSLDNLYIILKNRKKVPIKVTSVSVLKARQFEVAEIDGKYVSQAIYPSILDSEQKVDCILYPETETALTLKFQTKEIGYKVYDEGKTLFVETNFGRYFIELCDIQLKDTVLDKIEYYAVANNRLDQIYNKFNYWLWVNAAYKYKDKFYRHDMDDLD